MNSVEIDQLIKKYREMVYKLEIEQGKLRLALHEEITKGKLKNTAKTDEFSKLLTNVSVKLDDYSENVYLTENEIKVILKQLQAFLLYVQTYNDFLKLRLQEKLFAKSFFYK